MSESRAIYRTSSPTDSETTPPSRFGKGAGGLGSPDSSDPVLSIISRHIGRAHAISRTDLLRSLHLDDRQVRDQIRQLRKLGHLIGSASGVEGGYYLIATREEYNDFMAEEFLARIKDMSETVDAMNRAALVRFGPSTYQLILF